MARIVTRGLITQDSEFNQQPAETLDSRDVNEEK